MGKKSRSIAVRLEEQDFEYLAEVAARLELPTDGRAVISRAVQQIIRLMRASVTVDAIAGQGMLRQQCLQGGAA